MAPIVICFALFSTFAAAYAKSACRFVEHPDKALSSDYSAFITGAATLQACMDTVTLGRHEAVAFNHVTHECCSVPAGLHYNLVNDTQWTSYTLSSTAAPVTATSTEVGSSTSVSVHMTTTSSQASAPAILGNHTLINSTTVDGVSIALYFDNAYNVYVTWDEAASMCRSIGWWLGQLTTDELFYATQNLVNNSTDYYYPFLGARFNETSGDFEWTKSNTAVHPSFWYNGMGKPPNEPYATWSVAVYYPYYNLLNWDPSWTSNCFICTSQ